MSHALLPPSSAEQWVNCPGWASMTEGLRDTEESEAARIGTKVHTLCAEVLTGELQDPIILYTEEELECAKVYADYCENLVSTYDLSSPFVEHHLKMPSIHEENSGTPDFVLINRKRGIIHVVDYKHGYGIVEATWNWQLLNYLVGVQDTFKLDLSEFSCTLTIVQPRAFHQFGTVRSWCPSNRDISKAISKLWESAGRATSNAPTCNAGSHCKYCEALFMCPSATQKGMDVFDTITLAKRLDLSESALSLQYDLVGEALSLFKNLQVSLEAQMVGRLKEGKSIPNYRMEGKSGNLEWAVTNEEAISFGDIMGIDLRKPSSPITPTQAKKKGLDVEGLTSRSIGVKLTKFDLQNAQRIFKI